MIGPSLIDTWTIWNWTVLATVIAEFECVWLFRTGIPEGQCQHEYPHRLKKLREKSHLLWKASLKKHWLQLWKISVDVSK
jgi:hypothetical protein